MLSAIVHEEIEKSLGSQIESTSVFAASDFNQAYRLQIADGRETFVKLNERCPNDCFAAEAFGLNKLRKTRAFRVPECYAQAEKFIAIEWLAPVKQDRDYDEKLARGLAALHSSRAESFGFQLDNYCGASPQRNSWYEDGYAFFAECRLMPQARRAFDSGLLSARLLKSVETISACLPDLIPKQAAALLHGDLWCGNVLCTGESEPALIDPASYYGWPESDLAMMHLFGGFSSRVFSAYEECRPIPGGFKERSPIYNLYHLMNHLNLFGHGYLSDVKNILRRFS